MVDWYVRFNTKILNTEKDISNLTDLIDMVHDYHKKALKNNDEMLDFDAMQIALRLMEKF